MKRIIFMLPVLVLLSVLFLMPPDSAYADEAVSSSGTGIAIDENNFPDEKFRTCVNQFDSDGDGFLSDAETSAVKEIDIGQSNNASADLRCKSLEGIQHFKNITQLFCENNALKSLDLSNFSSLENVYCYGNNLTSLDLSDNASLRNLYCHKNELTDINLKGTYCLATLRCSDNNLTNLDLRESVAGDMGAVYIECSNNELTSTGLKIGNIDTLAWLECYNNELTSIDLNGVKVGPAFLDCSGNALTSLDVKNIEELKRFNCADNALTTLDISENSEINDLNCSNNRLTNLKLNSNAGLKLICAGNALTSLDISKNLDMTYLDCSDNELTSLNVRNHEKLADLYCAYNKLTSLDIHTKPNLQYLNCSHNELTSLDVTMHAPEDYYTPILPTMLIYLNCSDNKLTSLRLREVPEGTITQMMQNLQYLNCSNNALTSLDISNNMVVKHVTSINNVCNIEIDPDTHTFDLSTLPDDMYPSRIISLRGATRKGNILTADPYAAKITYKYDIDHTSGAKTADFTLKIVNPQQLPAPARVTAALYGYNDVKVSWSSVPSASGYYVYYRNSTAANYSYLGDTTGTSFNKANLSDGCKYYFKVIPYIIEDDNKYKGQEKVCGYIYTLKKLSTPKVYKYSSRKVKVTWNNINGESGYQISKSTKRTGTYIAYTYKTTTAKYKTLSAKKGKTYYYKVRAYKTVNGKKIYGPWSAVRAYKLR